MAIALIAVPRRGRRGDCGREQSVPGARFTVLVDFLSRLRPALMVRIEG